MFAEGGFSEGKRCVGCILWRMYLVLLSVLEILLSINWNAERLALSVNVPWIAIVPGILMILYDIICKARGKKSYGAWAIGFCLLLIPIIVIGAAFLICGIFMGK